MSRTRPYNLTCKLPDGRTVIEHDVFLCAKHAGRARGTVASNGSDQRGTVTAIEPRGPTGASICEAEACDGGWRFELPATEDKPN